MVLPFNNFTGNSPGEELFWKKCKGLPQNYVSFHNYYIGLKEVDTILLVPEKGILVIEIKSYRAANIIDVPDNNTIRRKNCPPDPYSPMKQASAYRYKLINDVLKPAGLDSVFAIAAVCYPYISEEDFFTKKLDKISSRQVTILQEDLISAESLRQKISSIFDFVYENISLPGLLKNGFFPPLLEQVGNLISHDFRNEGSTTESDNAHGIDPELSAPEEKEKTETEPEVNHDPAPEKKVADSAAEEPLFRDYSILIYSCDGAEFSEVAVMKLVAAWLSGTHVQLFSSSQKAIDQLLEEFQKAINSLGIDSYPEEISSALKLKNNQAFRLEINKVNATHNSFTIINGEGYRDCEEKLRWLDANSSFNYGQYCMVHAPLINVIVKAGAGTGKTFSLVSRFNFLVWKESITPEDLPGSIAMITFTNDSADQMKKKLSQNFLNFYLLTGNPLYLDYIEAVEDTKISTIDSLARAILSRYAVKLGLGVEFSITTGSYQRAQILHEAIDAFVSSHPQIINSVPMSMFHLEQRLQQLLEKFDNKNVDLVNDFEKLDFGGGAKQLPPDLLTSLKEVQEQLSLNLTKNNTVCLGDLIRKLGQLSEVLHRTDLDHDTRIRYLFVDEFQDTDNVQIELIHRFQDLIGFKYFVVGDTKQCIYRFRGAEEEAFETLKNWDQEAEVYQVALRKNYRTDSSLLNQMNGIFSAWNADNDLQYAGDDILTGTKDYGSEPIVMRTGDVRNDDQFLIQTISDAVKAVGNGKIAILVRFNAQIKTIQEICARNGISVSTDVGGELFSSDPVIDLYKLLMAMRYNQSPAHLYNLYTTSFVEASLPKSELMGYGREGLIEQFRNDPPVENWNQYLEAIRQEPILKVLQSVIEQVAPWNVFARKIAGTPEEQKRNMRYYVSNLDQLFEDLIKISNTDYLTLNKLTDYLELMITTRQEKDAREPFGMEAADGSLICTTVHKSKGAEFDAVILPFCDFDITCKRERGVTDLVFSENRVGYRILSQEKQEVFINDNYVDFEREEAVSRRHEETRILYVALTRARQALYCMLPAKDPVNGVNWASKLKEG